MARSWFDELAREGYGALAGPYAVTDACDDYSKHYQHRRCKNEKNRKGRLTRIRGVFGPLEAGKPSQPQVTRFVVRRMYRTGLAGPACWSSWNPAGRAG